MSEKPFGCVVCGVDGSRAGEEAVRQGAALCDDAGHMVLISVTTSAAAAHPEAAVMMREQAAAALESASRLVGAHPSEQHELEGDAVAGLLATVERVGGSLLAVGSHGSGRVAGILAGSVATGLLHRARCSVLIARPPDADERFASRVVVGLDGSTASMRALSVAEHLSDRLGATLSIVAAAGAALDLGELPAQTTARVRVDEHDPVDALLAAADDADLVVVGSRGLTGLHAIRSVSERLAHRARASVLVVREQDPPPERR